jgi:molybdopterin synthase catalytic subunit
MIEITSQPIDTQRVIASAQHPSAGAVNVFIGTIRDSAQQRRVIQLEYDAYEPMAIAEIQKVINATAQQWPLLAHAVSHRIGVLYPGEVAVVVAVATKHRKESFEAGQFIMDQIKLTVPIFKKEIFEGGQDWVGAFQKKL